MICGKDMENEIWKLVVIDKYFYFGCNVVFLNYMGRGRKEFIEKGIERFF